MPVKTCSQKECGQYILNGYRIYRVSLDGCGFGLVWHLVRTTGAVA